MIDHQVLVHSHAPQIRYADHLSHLGFAISLNPPVPERNVYRELECAAGEVRTRTGRWLRLNGQLLRWVAAENPPPHFLCPVCSHGYVTHVHTSDVSAAADLAVALWFMDAHRSTHTRTHTQPQGSNCWGLSREEVTIKMPLAHSYCVRQRESADNKILAPPVNLPFSLCQQNLNRSSQTDISVCR